MGLGAIHILLVILFLYTHLSIVVATNVSLCPGSYCNTLYINYPFKDQNTKSQDPACTYIDLLCVPSPFSGSSIALLSLPHAGDFYVSDISYFGPFIKLRDPGDCLMKRFMENLSLSSSPLKAITSQVYAFYTCPMTALIIVNHYFWPIYCLSNDTNATVASSTAKPEYMLDNGCKIIGTWLLPVLTEGQFEYEGANGDLYLTWDSTSCIGCQHKLGDNKGGSKGLDWGAIVSTPYFLPSFVTAVMLIIFCMLHIIKCILGRDENNSDEPPSPPQASEAIAIGLDESKISSCTELVILSESIITSLCSICLESYHSQEHVRSIATCRHSFHANCIQQWLIKSSTCPVCRTVLLGNPL